MSRPGRAYGPHRPEDAPESVRVLRARYGRRYESDEPVPVALLEQRARLNTLAHEKGTRS